MLHELIIVVWFAIGCLCQAPVQETCDILVYAATPAGCAAAVVAANQSNPTLRVCLVEPTLYLGGMLTAGGIGLRDTNDFMSVFGDSRSFAFKWARRNQEFYNASQLVLQPDVVIGNRSLYDVLLSITHNPIYIALNEALVESGGVEKDGNRIVRITTERNGDPSRRTTWAAKVFIDASYDGDLVMAGNISFTSGRESRAEYGEELAGVQPFNKFQNFLEPLNPFYANGSIIPFVSPHSLPAVGSADDVNMPYSYRPCITNDPANRVPFYAPAGYNKDDFELLRRYVASFKSPPSIHGIVGVLPYKQYPSSPSRAMRYDLCEGGAGPQGQAAPFTSDQPEINNGYVPASRAGKAAIADRIRSYVQGMMHYLATDPAVPASTRNSTSSFGYCRDTEAYFGPTHFPPLLYVREGVRLVGDFVATFANVIRGRCEHDSIASSSWTIDIHPMRRVVMPASAIGPFPSTQFTAYNEGQVGFQQFSGNGSVWEVRYAVMLPKRSEAVNLLVPVCVSVSHVVFGSVRVEPTFVQIGQAAGAAAWLAVRDGVAVQDVNIAALQIIQRNNGVDPHYGHYCP